MKLFNSAFRCLSAMLIVCVGLSGCGSSSSASEAGQSSPAANSSQSSLLSSSSISSLSIDSSESSAVSSFSEASSDSSSSDSSAAGIESALTPVKDFYGVYVAAGRPGENGLLGDADKEQIFLTFVRDNGFNYIIFYDLFNEDLLLSRAEQVASLISRAKQHYGVKQVALALGSKAGADAAIAYNQGRNASQKIDVLNLEYEFWNEPNRLQAFEYALDVLRYLKAVGRPQGMATETYIGWINAQEGQMLARELDRVLVHYYRQNDVNLIEYGLDRLESLASGRTSSDAPLVISPIFSNEGPLNTNDIPFMGAWLESNPHEKAYLSWLAGYELLTEPWKNKLLVEGATWFIYDKFLDVRNLESHITLHPASQQVCAGDTVTLTVVSSVSDVRYCWMFDGACLQNSSKVGGADTAALTLLNLSAESAGEYYARVISEDASNPQTFASQSAFIDLNACL